ncbi:ankyrin repeat domain-containing protein SOWAHA-like [Diretmus argenteus]
MEVTQESVLSLLVAGGGKVKNSDLLAQFKGRLNCDDPAEKKRNRELFKSFVNNVATVKEIDGVRYVAIKKRFHHLLQPEELSPARGEEAGKGEQEEARKGAQEEAGRGAQEEARKGEQEGTGKGEQEEARKGEQEEAGKGEQHEEGDAGGGSSTSDRVPDQTAVSDSEGDSENVQHAIHLALRRSKLVDIQLRRSLKFDIVQSSHSNRDYAAGACTPKTNTKPYALPLRMPPPSATRVEIHKLKGDPGDPPEGPDLNRSSPQLRRAVKATTKPSEEPKESSRFPTTVPLEQSEHEWLVKLAAGHWSQVYGLLLRDNQLAEKRDFMSGFTALHWAAKSGNGEMLEKIIELSRLGGVDVDINAKTHGGYTPLHIAALHSQEFILAMLMDEYGADATIRDNCGKRAYHYLHDGVSERVREMLGQPKAQQQDAAQHEKEELDLFPDLSKSLHTISRLFQPHVTGHKKKHKQRPSFYSLSDDPREEREPDSGSKHRAVSDAFM